MPAVSEASAIVLAGGRSSRFGSDKMAAEIDGELLLHRAIRVVASVCAEVIIVGAPNGLAVPMPEGLGSRPLIVLDDEEFEGPLAAFAHASGAATHERLLLIGGDMPDLQAAVLQRLLVWPPGQMGACLVADGWVQPLPMGLDRAVGSRAARELVAAGERSLRKLVASLDIEQIPEPEWRALDPDALSLRDIDRPANLKPRVVIDPA